MTGISAPEEHERVVLFVEDGNTEVMGGMGSAEEPAVGEVQTCPCDC